MSLATTVSRTAATTPRPPSEVRAGQGRASKQQIIVLTALPLAVWVVVVVVARNWGLHLIEEGRHIVLPTPPILGEPGEGWRSALALPLLVGLGGAWLLPSLCARWRWRTVLATTPMLAVVWGVALAWSEGVGGLTRGPSWNTEYQHDVPAVAADPAGFLQRFTEHIADYGVHVRGHPPGMVLLLAGLDRLGLHGPGWVVPLALAGLAAAVAAVLVVVREVAGEPTARRAAPFVALAPAAIWMVTSSDAFFTGVSAWAVALLLLALRRGGRRSFWLAVGGGVLAGLTVLLSYGLVLVAAIPIVAAIAWRRWKPLVVAGAAASAVLLVFVPLGYWWPAGLLATKHEYDTLAIDRPYSYFFFANIGAWALALGPAIAVALARLRNRRLWIVVGGGVLAALLADVSGMSEGEVERIWLPFTIWVLAAGAVLARSVWRSRIWLGIQVASAIGVTWMVTTQW